MANSFPLEWPAGVSRTPRSRQNRSRFNCNRRGGNGLTIRRSIGELGEELRRLGAVGVVVSTNVPVKSNGDPYSQENADDVGVAVYFRLNDKPYCLPCDRWDRVADNLYAVVKHIEAMRGQLRWGVATAEQAFAGFKALTVGRSCWEVLGVMQGASVEDINTAYRALAKVMHPDTGGVDGAMVELNNARDQAMRVTGGKS